MQLQADDYTVSFILSKYIQNNFFCNAISCVTKNARGEIFQCIFFLTNIGNISIKHIVQNPNHPVKKLHKTCMQTIIHRHKLHVGETINIIKVSLNLSHASSTPLFR